MVNVKSRSAVMQESRSVSTVSSCDATTQTPVHAETQTEQSAVSVHSLFEAGISLSIHTAAEDFYEEKK